MYLTMHCKIQNLLVKSTTISLKHCGIFSCSYFWYFQHQWKFWYHYSKSSRSMPSPKKSQSSRQWLQCPTYIELWALTKSIVILLFTFPSFKHALHGAICSTYTPSNGIKNSLYAHLETLSTDLHIPIHQFDHVHPWLCESCEVLQ